MQSTFSPQTLQTCALFGEFRSPFTVPSTGSRALVLSVNFPPRPACRACCSKANRPNRQPVMCRPIDTRKKRHVLAKGDTQIWHENITLVPHSTVWNRCANCLDSCVLRVHNTHPWCVPPSSRWWCNRGAGDMMIILLLQSRDRSSRAAYELHPHVITPSPTVITPFDVHFGRIFNNYSQQFRHFELKLTRFIDGNQFIFHVYFLFNEPQPPGCRRTSVCITQQW